MSDTTPKGRVLVIAGSDSGGGAGIQADIKTITALGAYASTAITAVTVQNTLGVYNVHPIPIDIVSGQIKAVLSDIGADCIKIGMLFSAGIMSAVMRALDDVGYEGQIVLDPVMIATSGDKLIDTSAIETLKSRLMPRASVITPNVPEAEMLTGYSITGEEDMLEAGRMLVGMGAKAVVMKGGHLDNADSVVDMLVTGDGVKSWHHERIHSTNTHGTGCTMASAIAAALSEGKPLEEAVEIARAFVKTAIKAAPDFGQGNGPMGHHRV